MAKCLWCEKSGFFINTTKNGLCKRCEAIVVPLVIQHHQHFNESYELIETSKNIDTILYRLDYMADLMRDLLKFENKGIKTISPKPSEFLANFQTNRDKYLISGLEREFDKLKTKVDTLKTARGKENNIIKFRDLIQKYELQLSNPEMINPIKEKVKLYAKNFLLDLTW